MKTTPARNQQSALDAARIEALRACIERQGSLWLNAQTFQMLREGGLSRRDVDRGIEAMNAAGRIVFDSTCGVVVIRLAGARKEGA